MENVLLSIILFLIGIVHFIFVCLLKNEKLKINGLFTWLGITIFSIFICIVQFEVMSITAPIFPIMGLIGQGLLAIALVILICKYKKIKK